MRTAGKLVFLRRQHTVLVMGKGDTESPLGSEMTGIATAIICSENNYKPL